LKQSKSPNKKCVNGSAGFLLKVFSFKQKIRRNFQKKKTGLLQCLEVALISENVQLFLTA